MSIGERIIALRTEKGVSQTQLSSALGISRQAVSKWENDQSSPDTLKLIQLADLLETNVEYLATGRHAACDSKPKVIIEKVDNIVEKVVEKPVIVEKIVEVEKVVKVERIVPSIIEKPVIKKVYRTKFLRNPIEFVLLGILSLAVGFALGLLF